MLSWHHHQEGQQHLCLSAEKPVNMPKESQGHLLQNICEASSGMCGHSLGSTRDRKHKKVEAVQQRATRFVIGDYHYTSIAMTRAFHGKPSSTENSKPWPFECSTLYMPWRLYQPFHTSSYWVQLQEVKYQTVERTSCHENKLSNSESL